MQILQDEIQVFPCYEPKALGNHKLGLRLERGTQGHLKEVPEILLATTTTAFSYIRGN